MKTLLFSAVALCAIAGFAPALAASAPAPQQSQHQVKAMTRAEMVQKVQERFARLDANKDGYVTKAEMESAQASMHQRMAGHMEQPASAMFDRMDANHDGSVTRTEFEAPHTAMADRMEGKRMGMRSMHRAMDEHMFATADGNNDGRVSLQEATAAAAARFDRLDANHDGTITPDERRAARKAMRGSPGRS
jgi:Ca2+-binding EF-hand superfamily protein